jgi:hypothetical protein
MTQHAEDEMHRINRGMFPAPPPAVIRERSGRTETLLADGFPEEERSRKEGTAGERGEP